MLRRNNLHYSYFRTFINFLTMLNSRWIRRTHTYTRSHTITEIHTQHNQSQQVSLFRYLFFCKSVYPHLKDLSQMLTTSSRIKIKLGKGIKKLRTKRTNISKNMISIISLILLFQLDEIIGSNSSSTEVRL